MKRKPSHDWWGTTEAPKPARKPPKRLHPRLTDEALREMAIKVAPRASQLLRRDWQRQTPAYREHLHRIAVESVIGFIDSSRKTVTRAIVYQKLTQAEALQQAEMAFIRWYGTDPTSALEAVAQYMATDLMDKGMTL